MAPTPGISGVAVALTAAGGILLWTGLVNRPVREALQDLLQGKTPGTSGAPTGPALADIQTGLDSAIARQGSGASGGAGVGKTPAPDAQISRFVSEALAQLGKPYRWGAAGPNAFDCSGLVTWCLKVAGLDNQRRITTGYLIWSGAFDVARDQCFRGDLVCWTGHMGIALSRDEMVHAPGTGRPVQRGRIWSNPPPKIRRIRAGGA
jgi:cell wall-associated NlpC family hydrolase